MNDEVRFIVQALFALASASLTVFGGFGFVRCLTTDALASRRRWLLASSISAFCGLSALLMGALI